MMKKVEMMNGAKWMNKWATQKVAVGLIMALALPSFPAMAAQDFKVGYVSLDRLLAESAPAKNARATLDKNFPDGYSAYNKEEHFAQGVTYWLIPQDAPARFGLNKSWVQQFNPQQFDFINSIDEAHGDFSKLSCAL